MSVQKAVGRLAAYGHEPDVYYPLSPQDCIDLYGAIQKAKLVLDDLADRHTLSEHSGELDYLIEDGKEAVAALST